MSHGECDQAQLTHLIADVGPPPTGPAAPSQVSAHPPGRSARPCGASRKANSDPKEFELGRDLESRTGTRVKALVVTEEKETGLQG